MAVAVCVGGLDAMDRLIAAMAAALRADVGFPVKVDVGVLAAGFVEVRHL